MTLNQYLAAHSLTEAAFADLIGSTQPNVHRLRNGQVPSKELMAVIVEKTGGAVQPNDFFGVTSQ